VRHAECFNSDAAHLKAVARHKNPAVEFFFELLFNRLLSQAIAVDRNSKFATEREQPLYMIGMLVRYQDTVKALGGASELGQSLANLLSAESRINQNASVIRLQVRAIAARTAAENDELHCHNRKRMEMNSTGQFLLLKIRTLRTPCVSRSKR
jgi:hypothetical protein